MADLLSSQELELWSRALAIYKDVIRTVDEQRSKKKGGKQQQDSLSSLDKWYQEDLPVLVASRSPSPYINHEELAKLMKWKLTRGKFRPRLTEMVKENKSDTVEDVTAKAFSQLPNVKKAIETLKTLKAVGPATASAILCAYKPSLAPFMSDEATIAVPDIIKLDYTLKQYLIFSDAMCEKAVELSQLGEKKWTAHDVEVALWSYSLANRLKPSLLEDDDRFAGVRSDSRPSGQCSGDTDDLPPPAKRTKTVR